MAPRGLRPFARALAIELGPPWRLRAGSTLTRERPPFLDILELRNGSGSGLAVAGSLGVRYPPLDQPLVQVLDLFTDEMTVTKGVDLGTFIRSSEVLWLPMEGGTVDPDIFAKVLGLVTGPGEQWLHGIVDLASLELAMTNPRWSFTRLGDVILALLRAIQGNVEGGRAEMARVVAAAPAGTMAREQADGFAERYEAWLGNLGHPQGT